jgi:hypothetical protein
MVQWDPGVMVLLLLPRLPVPPTMTVPTMTTAVKERALPEGIVPPTLIVSIRPTGILSLSVSDPCLAMWESAAELVDPCARMEVTVWLALRVLAKLPLVILMLVLASLLLHV